MAKSENSKDSEFVKKVIRFRKLASGHRKLLEAIGKL